MFKLMNEKILMILPSNILIIGISENNKEICIMYIYLSVSFNYNITHWFFLALIPSLQQKPAKLPITQQVNMFLKKELHFQIYFELHWPAIGPVL